MLSSLTLNLWVTFIIYKCVNSLFDSSLRFVSSLACLACYVGRVSDFFRYIKRKFWIPIVLLRRKMGFHQILGI